MFHQLALNEEALDALADKYEVFPGSSECRWRQFATDVRQLPPPDELEPLAPTAELQRVFMKFSAQLTTKELDLIQGLQVSLALDGSIGRVRAWKAPARGRSARAVLQMIAI